MGSFCVAFPCSSCACVGFPGTQVSPNSLKNKHAIIVKDYKLVLGLSECMPDFSLCGPEMDWWHVPDVPHLSSTDHCR